MVVLLSILLFLLLPLQSLAAQRVQIDATSKSGPAAKPLSVKVRLMESDAENSKPSVGEKAEFKVKDPKDGQICATNPAPSDNEGYVYGTCTSESDTTMTVYANSKDRGDSSEDLTLTFTDKESGTTPAPSGTVKKQTLPNGQTQTTAGNEGAALANQPGMAEDRPLMDGLAESRDDGASVAGASTDAPAPAPQQSNDIDLLTSLVYLTGGIVLTIAGIYFIYIQSRNASRRKKDTVKNTAAEPEPPTPAA